MSRIDESMGMKKTMIVNLASMKKKSEELNEEIITLQKSKGPKNELKYKTPISRTLQSEEMIFECKNGRITPVDIGAMLEEISGQMQVLGEKLRTQWELEEVSQNYGAFKIRYTLERERSALELATPNAIPDPRSNFRFSLTRFAPIHSCLRRWVSSTVSSLRVVLGSCASLDTPGGCGYS